MSQENVEIVRAAFETWNAGDMDGLRETYDPGIIWRPPEGWPEPGPYAGREAVMRQFEQLRETWDTDTLEPISDFIDVGDRVAVRLIWRGVGHGPESNMEMTGVYTARKGRILGIELFWDHAEALEALGAFGPRRSRRLLSLRDTARAMSEENVEFVRRAYAVFDNDLDRLLALLDPAVEWISPSDAIEPGVRQGHQGVRDAFAATAMAWDEPTHTAEDFLDAENRVLVTVTFRGHGRGSGMQAERREFHAWTLRNGAAVRFQWFYKRDQALEAVGLSE